MCLVAMKQYVNRSESDVRDVRVSKAVSTLLSGKVFADLAARILRDDIFGQGRVHAMVKLNFFNTHHYALLDSIFCRHDKYMIKVASRMFSKADVMETVIFAAENFENFAINEQVSRGFVKGCKSFKWQFLFLSYVYGECRIRPSKFQKSLTN